MNCNCKAEKSEDSFFHSLFHFPNSVKFSNKTIQCEKCKDNNNTTSRGNWVECESKYLNNIIAANGFTLIPFHPNDSNWIGFINHGKNRRDPDRDPRAVIKNPLQKYNQMPGSEDLCNKVPFTLLHRDYQKMFGFEEFGFYPESWIVSEEFEEFKKIYLENTTQKFIYKPSAGSFSIGVKLIQDLGTLELDSPAIVQKFIHPPFVFDETKAEVRYFVVVTSYRPLRIYLHTNGLVKIFSLNHFDTSLSGNENVPVIGWDELWVHEEFYAKMAEKGFNIEGIQARLEDIMIKCLLMGEEKIAEECKKHLTSKSNTYQGWTFDFLFDAHGKPFLIEMNRFITIEEFVYESGSAQVPLCKESHVIGMLNLVGYPDYTAQPKSKSNNSNVTLKDVNVDLLRIFQNMNWNKEQIIDLMEAEDELNRNVGFKKIFPTTKTFKYLKYLTTPEMEPYIIQAKWEEIFENRRSDGILILKYLFEKIEL